MGKLHYILLAVGVFLMVGASGLVIAGQPESWWTVVASACIVLVQLSGIRAKRKPPLPPSREKAIMIRQALVLSVPVVALGLVALLG